MFVLLLFNLYIITMKKTIIISSLICLILGITIGWLVRGNNSHTMMTNSMHRMPDGSMMNNSGNQTMDGMMMDMMSGLAGKTGDAFDQAFLSEMIVHHQGAVDMARAVLTSSKRPELIKLANDIIAAQTKEIGMMQAWQKEWFK